MFLCLKAAGAHLGVYLFKQRTNTNGCTIEFPYFQNLNVGNPKQMMIELRQAQIQPMVLVLNRNRGNNHFQAVTYPDNTSDSIRDPKAFETMADRHQELLHAFGVERLPKGKNDMRTITLLANHTIKNAQKHSAASDAQFHDKGAPATNETIGITTETKLKMLSASETV
ncbi:hypothetical protein PF005_g29061 [Phytophthora fragariae]|nr:hypothetical protein PF005_g29061 [Phytophthora fragariae]